MAAAATPPPALLCGAFPWGDARRWPRCACAPRASAPRACGSPPTDSVAESHGVSGAVAAYDCPALSYAHSLLVVWYRLDDSTEVTLVKQIVDKGQNIEAAWPLGAAINALSVK